MKSILLSLVGIAIVLSGCSEETIKKEFTVRDSHVIEFVTLGFAEDANDENKGFGAFYYCYLNLATDSVFIQQKINPIEQPETFARAGIIAGISQNPVLHNYLEAAKQYKSGQIISEPVEEGASFCGPTYAIRNYGSGVEKILYFNTNDVDLRFVHVKDFILSLLKKEQLKPVKVMDEDKIVVPMVRFAGYDLRPPPPDLPHPPPPAQEKVN
ncbi:hypothetical protein H7F15_09700 [Pontibacter sp. Tf4]|uniref:hypothetical protein n=1 Tax=Pontibacter sp. Tf4 TaxID=2761620 RepID=UPI00162A4B78|nr:hypothetical protein [Pontibacter sp. Tf4]MBB6611310.1 hypothetical protein [Pontibacter sp. Tf4]